MRILTVTFLLCFSATGAFAAAHAAPPSVEASDQAVANGIVSAETVVAGENGWLVVHRTDETGGMKTGIFEYTLGAKEDGPIKIDDMLVMKTITVKAE